MDESYFCKRKYNRGRWRDGQWVFGRIERDTDKTFFKIVANRDAATLEAVTMAKVLPGTHIITDGWGVDFHLDTLAGGIYTHKAVIHEDNL